MHIIFERSDGLIRSNCNILALAWMPYYNESTFRKSHLTYQQRQLAHLTEPFGYRLPLEPPANVSQPEDVNRRGLQEILRRQPEVNNFRPTGRNNELDQWVKARAFNNSRLIEQLQRFVHTSQRGARQLNNCDLNDATNATINDHIDELYGKMDSFGWLAIGNIGKMVGVTLTATIEPAVEIDGRKSSANAGDEVNLIDLSENNPTGPESCQRKQAEGIAGATSRPDRKSARTNYNLRGHLDEVILVKWNEIYQKLASVDSKGNVLIWSKSNEKFTIQTPFYNKSKSVADFKWSNDGKTALICYTDSFILVGSSFSQRHWHSMLNLDDYHITCATWTPNDEQLLFGVSNGNIILIDLPTSELTELAVGQANIRTMCWSSGELNLRHLERARGILSAPICDQRSDTRASPFELAQSSDNRSRRNQNVVNRRRLSLNCALFCRQRPSSLLNTSGDRNTEHRLAKRPSSATRKQQASSADDPNSGCHREILAIDFADNTIKLFNGGLGDPKPRQIQVQLESYLMAWSSDGRLLAVGGFNIYTSAPSVGCLRCKYLNAIKFYNQDGQLVHERRINFTRYPITALTWAHDDRRLFVATGPRLHCAKVFMGVPQLGLLSMSCLYRNTKLMDKSDALMNLLKGQFVPSLLNWQSYNCPIEIESNDESKRWRQQQQSVTGGPNASGGCSNLLSAPTSCSLDGPDGEEGRGNTSDQQQAPLMNNVNITNFQLPAKLKSKIDLLFSQTTRQPYDGQFTLNDIAWHVPKNQQRLHCTLICYTHELPDASGCMGYQYKVQDSIHTNGTTNQQQQHQQQQQQQQRTKSAGNNNQSIEADLQFKIFVLYAEFQGSLVPILKARRIGFLKPEFVLFDPEPKFHGSLQRYHKVSDIYQNGPNCHRGLLSAPCAELHGASYMGNLSPLITRRQPSGPSSQATRNSAATRLDANRRRVVRDPHLLYLLNLSQQQQQQQQRSHSSRDKQTATSNELTQRHELVRAIERQRLRSLRAKLSGSGRNQSASVAGQSGLRSLPETSELIRIKSNIWGTKFKLINMSNNLVERKAVLGSVRYKASLLHLQPRQIHLNMKDMSNYCVLCSVHHHTKMYLQKRARMVPTARNSAAEKAISSSTPMSLIDLPLATPNHLLSPSSGRSPGRLNKWPGREQLDESEKLVLAVGDTIRVAPQLEAHQRYKLAERSSSSSLSSAPVIKPRHGSLLARTSVQTPPGRSPIQRYGQALSETKQATKRFNRADSSQSGTPNVVHSSGEKTEATRDDDDILTMSIDQGDQVQLEMSSESKKLDEFTQAGGSRQPIKQNVDERKIDDFLRANKTLKSIQTITSMIVDLSARAQEDVDAHETAGVNSEAQASPTKLLKIEDTSGMSQRSPSRYIPPETPVHRPRRLAAHNKRSLQTMSATSSPLAHLHGNRSLGTRNLTTTCHSLDPDHPLPPPPPPVPLRRRLSISAKRFIDGSLRSLSSLGVSGTSGNYLTGDEADTEESEFLVQHRRQRQGDKQTRFAHKHQSQPCTPMRGGLLPSRQTTIDLASLRSQVVEKLRLSSSWRSPARSLDEASRLHRNETRSSTRQHHERSASCTKRSNCILRGSREESRTSSSDHRRSQSLLSSSSSPHPVSSSSSSSSSSVSSNSSSSDEQEPDGMVDGDFSFLNETARRKLFKKSSRLSSSVKEFGEQRHENRSNSRNIDDRHRHASKRTSRGSRRTRPRRIRKCANKSICSSSNCCCGREFKLSNRPPVWNEQSQVYQLDFGGRVTQESAKNLQIDFNGSLALETCCVKCRKAPTTTTTAATRTNENFPSPPTANIITLAQALQFGRIDKCTYTLDYQFPFNAVQAMSIALASLTQRLK